MGDYPELLKELNEQAMRDHSRRSLRQYLIDNWIAILALIISIISLFK